MLLGRAFGVLYYCGSDKIDQSRKIQSNYVSVYMCIVYDYKYFVKHVSFRLKSNLFYLIIQFYIFVNLMFLELMSEVYPSGKSWSNAREEQRNPQNSETNHSSFSK